MYKFTAHSLQLTVKKLLTVDCLLTTATTTGVAYE